MLKPQLKALSSIQAEFLLFGSGWGCWKGDKSQRHRPFSRFVFSSAVIHFPFEKGTRRLVEIRNGNVKVSTYCIKFFQINASIKLSMIFHIK